MVEARAVATAEEAHAAAGELGYPVALKALASEHKSDEGGVVLGIVDAAGLDGGLRQLRPELAPSSGWRRSARASS